MQTYFILVVIQLLATTRPSVLAQLRRATRHISKQKEIEEDRRIQSASVTAPIKVPTPPVPTIGTTPQPVRPSQKPVRPTPRPVRTTSKPVVPMLPTGRPVVSPKPTTKGNFLTLPPAVGGSGSQSGKTCRNSSFYQSLTGASTIIPCKQNSDCANWKQDGDGCCLHPYCICGAISATEGSSAVTCLTF